MKIRTVKFITVWILLLAMALSVCGCGKKKYTMPDLTLNLHGRTNTFSFSAQESGQLQLSKESAQRLLSALALVQPEYPYAYLYEMERVKQILEFDASVQSHQYSALNDAGKLETAHFTQTVLQNNRTFLEDKPFGFKEVEAEYVQKLCGFIVEVVEVMRAKYPDVDWQRVYCNLGNLKILYDVGMLSFAQVSSDLILSISQNNTGIMLSLKGEDAFSRVMTHEIMHIIQLGCDCEQIPSSSRRAGIALFVDDFALNTADWTWFVEGAAERNMCNLTGGDAVTYQYKMDYICSMTMSTLLRDDVKADTMETICFYDDPQLLFDAFGCENESQRDELLNMMITLQVLQMQPAAFYEAYKEATGIDLMADEEAMNQFSYSLKPAICITLAKEFYENLILFLQENELTYNDLFFLINLFEGHLNQHLTYSNPAKTEINQPFITAYNTMRSALFDALGQDNPGLDITALYSDYNITFSGEKLLNAELDMLSSEKRAFLAERAQWQDELLGLGQKVPQ